MAFIAFAILHSNYFTDKTLETILRIRFFIIHGYFPKTNIYRGDSSLHEQVSIGDYCSARKYGSG